MGNIYEDYYLQQAGNGGIPIFVGSRFQRGHGGLGNLLGGLTRMFVPLLKKGGKTLLKEGLRTGVDILGDVVGGSDIKSSAKKRIQQSGSRLLNSAAASLKPPAPPGEPMRQNLKRKRSRSSKPSRSRNQSRNKKLKRRDIFG